MYLSNIKNFNKNLLSLVKTKHEKISTSSFLLDAYRNRL
ncbi:hypothetical protein AREALGSMS7_00102 [Arenibacter algicola]|uniref:Uncharacterized protein n=1 Tax=Arenibacter algicola TaxID=616991 RepID=A0A221UQQ8_9FLAO|nr:hypothetical protein AREALGSMS7_00102 [Arenibacter algicola]